MLDLYSVHVHNNQQVAALPQLDRGSDYESERHRFESYTPHHLRLRLPATGAFLLRKHRMDSNLGRGAGVKKTRSVFSPRASPPAGGRSRCGSAQRMRGILYAAPFEIKAPGNGGFSNMRKPLSIGMFVRARFETGLFRFPSGEPAHAAWLSRRLPGKLISAGSCGCASGGQPGMSAHPTAFRFSVRRYRTNPVFCRARPGGCPSKRS